MKQWFLLFATVMLANLAFAQQLRFKHLTSEDGFSTVLVKVPFQDDQGFIWLGTQDGLNKYDGFRFKVFRKNPTNNNSLPSSFILSICQQAPGLLVVGTSEGPGFFNTVNETCTRLAKPDARLNTNILAVQKLNDTTVLASTEEGLYAIGVKSRLVIKSYFGSQKIKVNTVRQLNGTIYIGTGGNGIYKLNAAGEIEKVPVQTTNDMLGKENLANDVRCLLWLNNKIYLGTFGNSVLQCSSDFKLEKQISFAGLDANATYINDLVSNQNQLFAATYSGLVVYNVLSGETNQYTRKEGPFEFNTRVCNGLLLDKSGNLWVGTDLGGVNTAFVRSMKFPISIAGYELRYHNIFSFCESSENKLILGGVKTFHELNLQTGEVKPMADFLGDGTALCIARENENVYWVGTWGNGLFRYDKVTRQAKLFLNSGKGGTVLCLKIRNGQIYAGTVGDGLFRINLKTLAIDNFTEKEGIPAPSISTIYSDNGGAVWLGTLEKGLAKMKAFDINNAFAVEKVYANTGEQGQIASNEIRAVNQDNKGVIWAATASGLSKARPDGTWFNYYEKDGLPNASLYSLLKDSTGNFWISCNSGLIKFNPLSPEDKPELRAYGAKDGLVNTEYNMGAFYLSGNGLLCFGGSSGFNLFRASQIKNNNTPPLAYVVGYKRGGKDVASDSLIHYKKHLDLSWRENYFQFELTALDYSDPATAKFSYMLDGYDAGWSEPSNVRYVSYTELPGGDYVFKVKAANSDGVWNEVPYEVSIRVVPPFWKTKLFYVLMALLLVGGSVGFTQYRTRAIKKENQLLEAKVAERTKELHEKNMDIMASIHYAQRIQAALLPSKETIFSKLTKVFILYRPKDIVSGDFYWFNEKNGVKIFATVDCTGHGVPGAFMSMIGHNLLNHIVLENGITDPGDILNALHRGVQAALRQGHNEISTNDGMDVSLLTIDERNKKISWAGANRPLVLVSPTAEFSRLEGDKFPVGGAQAHVDRVFITKSVEASAGSMAYMFTDGYADQFGGEKGKKFMVKRLHELLVAVHPLTAEEQHAELEKQFLDWKAAHEQVDDVLLVGIQI